MAKHNILGNKGEGLAVEFLQHNGYEILERTWRYNHKEIDIIAQKHGVLIFVEVKTRSSNYWGNPQDSVDERKQNFLIEASNSYIEQINFKGEAQFDVISIVFDSDGYSIEHIENAFYPEM